MKHFFITILILHTFQLSFSQISSKDLKINENNTIEPYDTTRNFLGEDVFQYIGQELYLLGKIRPKRSSGYKGFYTNFKEKNTDGVYTYKAMEGSKRSDYGAMAEKYFKVTNVHYHPRRETSDSFNTIYYIELIEKESNDTLYYKYDSDYADLFPFIVVSFFEKYKQLTLNNTLVFVFDTFEYSTDIETGNKIKNNLGDPWKCVDFFINEDDYTISLLLKNRYNQTTQLPFDKAFGRGSGASEHPNFFTIEDVNKYKSKFGSADWSYILKRQVRVGFTKEMVILAWGKPLVINNDEVGKEKWGYSTKNIVIFNGNTVSTLPYYDLGK